MLRGLGSWLGLENPTPAEKLSSEQREEKVVEAQNEVNKPQSAAVQDGEEDHENNQNEESNQGLGDYIFSFASSMTKKISDSVVETSQTIKKSVEEGKIDGIIDK
uniref:synapse-associated protein 1-like n=1 Tax=Doryrhamphus excisus TaxID=161450 RepID=UPI0025AE576C